MITDDGIIVDDPLDLDHLLLKYYYEELLDSITRYHELQMRFTVYSKSH